jgi:hypothetical protein
MVRLRLRYRKGKAPELYVVVQDLSLSDYEVLIPGLERIVWSSDSDGTEPLLMMRGVEVDHDSDLSESDPDPARVEELRRLVAAKRVKKSNTDPYNSNMNRTQPRGDFRNPDPGGGSSALPTALAC